MTAHAVPPVEKLTLLAHSLQGLDIEDMLGGRLQNYLPGKPDEAVSEKARGKLLAMAATPEDRVRLARELGCTYEALTNWVIWCDLRQLAGLTWAQAQALRQAGVMGVHDLALWARDDDRRQVLHAGLLPHWPQLTLAEVKNLGLAAAKIPSQIIADTTVIVVVKGAGEQKPEQTLGEFLGGFWPAIYQVDPSATLAQRHDVLPDKYISTPYDPKPLNLVAEIRCGERRIWVREPNWDAACVPDSALSALNKEWRMATFALVSWIYEYFAEDDSRRRSLPAARRKDFWRYLAANTLLNWAVFLHAGLALSWSFGQHGSLGPLLLLGLLLVLPAIGLAILPATQAYERKKKSVENRQPLEALPGMVNFGLVVLLLAFVISPWGYLLWVCAGTTILLGYLRARAIAWPNRRQFDSDERPEKYYSVAGENDPVTGQPRVYRRPNRAGLTRLIPWRWHIWQYRYLVVLGLPITFLGLTLARFLKWTKVLGVLGDFLEDTFSRVLSGGLGDVATYAMDPAKANSIRHVIQSDLMFFHDLPYVGKLHVFAHSQGTPITFETLFNHLPEAYTQKVVTYVTIGSVLDYYHQTNPILDPVFSRRFPVRQYRAFGPGFRWMNFWNFSDPITEFCGLEDYALVETAPVLPLGPDDRPVLPTDPHELLSLEAQLAAQTRLYASSPINIKSAASAKNHSEYWSNLDSVHGPLAQRVLGDLEPSEWDNSKFKARTPRIPHNQQVFLLYVLCLVVWLVPLLLLLHSVWPWAAFKGPIAQNTARVIQSVLEPIKVLELWHMAWWAIRGWFDAWTADGTWFGTFRNWFEMWLPAMAPVQPGAAEAVTTPWPVRFLAELLMILLTGGAYFGLLALLNGLYTWLASLLRRKPKSA